MLDDRHYMRSEYRPGLSMTTILLIANGICFLLQQILEGVTHGRFLEWFALSVDGLQHWRLYQLITFQFLHANLWHLLGNLLGLYFFGRAMEEMLGSRGMLKLYLISGTVGGLVQTALGFAFPNHFGGAVLGASAGVFGLVAAFAVSRPDQPITLLLFFILPVTFPAKLILAFAAATAIWGILAPTSMIAHAAHLGGMLAGIIYIKWISGSFSRFLHLPQFLHRDRVIITPPKRTWRSPPRKRRDDLPPSEFMSREVDPILEKISAQGIHSLTPREREILEAARSRMAR